MNIWNRSIEKKTLNMLEHGGLVEEETQNKKHSWKVQSFEGDRQGSFVIPY